MLEIIDDPEPLTAAECDRLDVREQLRARLIEWWEERSRDAIEDTSAGHVDQALTRVIMPVLDANIRYGA